jgi:hypothetical protein
VAAFVNREVELRLLAELVDRAARGSGVIVSVKGQPGIGKTSLLDAAAHVAGSAGAVFYQVSCHAQIGEFQSYGPFLALLAQIDQGGRRFRFRRFAGRAARTAGPELLSLVPSLGPLLKSAAEAVAGAVPGAPTVDPTAAAHLVTETVLNAVRGAGPAVIVIDDVHRIDASSCAVLSYLAEAVGNRPIVIVLLLRDQHDNVVLKDLLDELYIRGRLRRIPLRGLDTAAVAEFGRRVTGSRLDTRQARELAEQTSGHPLMLRLYLGEQTDRRTLPSGDPRLPELVTGSGAADAIRDHLTALIRLRLGQLAEDDRRLLDIGAVQGERFLSEVVAKVAGVSVDAADGQLYRLARDTYLVVADVGIGVAIGVDSDGYRFEHGLLQQTLYDDQSAGQRRRRHRSTAAELSRFSEQPGPPSLELLLEIARHSRAGHDYVGAGRSSHGAACRLAGAGTSIREVAGICRRGLEDLQHARPEGEVCRLRALLLELLLAATELNWTAERDSDGTNPVEQLAQDAIAAADQSEDANLRVRVRYLYGKVLLYTQGLHQALGPLREAWHAAREGGDAVSQLLAGCEYGRQLPKIDVARGIEVLSAAAHVAETDPDILGSTDPVVIRARDMVGLQIGVNLMDAGRLGAAVDRLRDAVARVQQRGTLGLLPIGLNYLAQAELAVAGLDEAEQTLQQAADLPSGREAGAWDAVNLAYLGWLKVVRRGDQSGYALLEQARTRSAQLWQANLAPLVANLYVTALLERRLDEDTARAAEHILNETIEETRRTGMVRSEVVALSLLGRLKHATGDLEAARQASTRAIEHLRNADWALAAVNAEEILIYHAIVIRDCGDIAAAKSAARRAAAEVRRKARSLPDDQQQQFLLDIPVNRLVAETVSGLADASSQQEPTARRTTTQDQ